MTSPVVTVHLAALGIYIASCLYLLLVVLPSAVLAADARIQRRRLAAAFRILNPTAIGALGILLVTGAVRLTDIKAGLGPAFFTQIGLPESVTAALTKKEGVIYQFLLLAILYEKHRWDEARTVARQLGVGEDTVVDSMRQATLWADNIIS